MLSGEIARKYGGFGLPDDTIDIQVEGSAGQSFGAFAMKGLTLRLKGEANDYLGKGLSGGKIIVTPPSKSIFEAGDNVIAGNTLFYGATSGEAYISGRVGQRFCVRNSGAVAVVEGIGDHGCEYMTGGVAVILGCVGKNFGAGMSGGIAFILDVENSLQQSYNCEMVILESLVNKRDINVVKNLIQQHYMYTKSNRAKKILDHWELYVKKIIKVYSPNYEKQLKSIL